MQVTPEAMRLPTIEETPLVLGTCSQMLRIKNKATQEMLSVKVLRPP
jgi:hypothetical protein